MDKHKEIVSGSGRRFLMSLRRHLIKGCNNKHTQQNAMLAWKAYTEEIDRASSKPFTTSTFCCWTLKDREEDRLHQRRGGQNSDGCIHTVTHPTCFDHQNFAKNGRNRCRKFGGGIPLHTHLRPSASLCVSLLLSLSHQTARHRRDSNDNNDNSKPGVQGTTSVTERHTLIGKWKEEALATRNSQAHT